MEKNYNHNILFKYFFIAITSLFLLQAGNVYSDLDNYFYHAYSTYVEYVVFPHDAGLINDSDPDFHADGDKTSPPVFYGFFRDKSLQSLYSGQSSIIPGLYGQQLININPVVHILHKKHLWHQSSDDDNSFRLSSM